MHFEVEHVFDAAIEHVETAMFHPDYAAFLIEHSDVLASAALKSFEDDGLRIRRRVLLAPRPAFDHIGSKKVPPEWFEFIEQSTWDRQSRTLSFDNIPIAREVASRVINRGEVVLQSVGAHKTRRVARAEIKLHGLPLLARPFAPLVEQMLAREARRMLDGEANALRAWLLQHGPAQSTLQA
jgi:hypothetical protein